MQTEIEAKFLNIRKDDFRKRLRDIGPHLVQPERLMRRKIFDFVDERLMRVGGWVRVRDEGDKITLSYKQLNDRSLHGTQEVSVTVDDFERAGEFIKAIGLVEKAYQETKRESWRWEGTEIEIDTWPWIPTFVEIEGAQEEKVRAAVSQLGLDWSQALHGSVEIVYQHYYNVTEQEIDNWEPITFVPVPAWLEDKRKKNIVG